MSWWPARRVRRGRPGHAFARQAFRARLTDRETPETIGDYNAQMTPTDIVTRIREIIGLSASFGGYRKDLPSDADDLRYQELWAEVESGLSELRDQGIELPNPNPHRRLAAMWAWIWSEGGSGKERKERPTALYADSISKLQLLNAHGAPALGATGAAALPLRPRLAKQLDETFANGDLVAVVFVDLDGFKGVNDRSGHQEGDRCLDAVAAAIQAVIRGRGYAFRYGGDEFTVLLPNVTLPEASATAQRLREEIARVGAEFQVTASVGVACSDGEGIADGAALIAAADEAAYVSKFNGKNRTTVWPIEPSVRDAINRQRAQAQGR
jgi:diguanylate cyclase (GGDEF)-like protein